MALRVILGIFLGAGIGATIGYFGRCASGVCPLTSNPYSGAIYGAVIGLIIALISK